MQKISKELLRIQEILDLPPDGMAFLLDMDAQMYRYYTRGRWDDTYSIRKEYLRTKLHNINELIEIRLHRLQRAQRRWNERKNTNNFHPSKKKSKAKV